ncbi:MAG: aldehyde dehydrogenase family protein [Rhodospirillaceae bacterium]
MNLYPRFEGNEAGKILAALEIDPSGGGPNALDVRSPIDGGVIARVPVDTAATVNAKLEAAAAAFIRWREIPAPRRGELIRRFGDELRARKEELAALVTLESGKIISEGRGEVQEIIDMADFAVGLSRQLYGLTMPSERAGHHLQERWHPLGVVGVISAFNFPVAVWGWNFCLAIVCGDPVIWKPSEKTPLTALACLNVFRRVANGFDPACANLLAVVAGDRALGRQLADDRRVALLSATGSTAMGRDVAPRVAQRLGRSLLELGGNNAAIVTPSADLELAKRAILFSAAGTAGQRCTTLRRLFVHREVYDKLVPALKRAVSSLPIGDPFAPGTLVGPLIDGAAFARMQQALERARAAGGTITGGERVFADRSPNAFYVRPALCELARHEDFLAEEIFAPLLYVVPYEDFREAVALQNAVPQGLSSALFTMNMREAEYFTSAAGSDCGIANVNTGPSGAEIGGAFGGEKDTGGGREAGSDSWKSYMRRTTSALNFSSELPLAQGVQFDAV